MHHSHVSRINLCTITPKLKRY